jgi:outer membrane receptor for ferrienterochelin and colicin
LLKPETATTKTIGFDYAATRLPGFKVSGTYYDLAYTNRIAVLPNLYGALESPTFASFVTRDPSVALQQSLIAAASASGGVYNFTGAPFDPTQTAAIVNNAFVNVARQELEGFDLLLNYKVSLSGQTLDLFVNGTYLDFRETLSPTSPQMTLSGTAFYPPKIRMRGGVTWSYGSISTTGVLNYMGSEVNTFAAGQPHVASWTTVDMHLAYSPAWTGWLSGLRASLSVRNLFDRDPPYVQYLSSNFPGANYDANNASPLGRFMSLQIVKKW